MPLTLTLTQGVLPNGAEKTAIAKITDAMLKWHGLSDNPVMKPNITASVHIMPRGSTFSGGVEVSGAWVEWKVPSFAFSDREIQVGFGNEVTEIIHELSGYKQPRDNIYINVIHAVDGLWNFNGVPMNNEQIINAIS